MITLYLKLRVAFNEDESGIGGEIGREGEWWWLVPELMEMVMVGLLHFCK